MTAAAPLALSDRATRLLAGVEAADPRPLRGRVRAALGTVVRARIPDGRIGDICVLTDRALNLRRLAQIVGFEDGVSLLAPLGGVEGLSERTEVEPAGGPLTVPYSPALRGRVIDALGAPVDGRGPIAGGAVQLAVHAPAPDPMQRSLIEAPQPFGIRAIDALLTCGRGQRIGIYGDAGGGKSTLLSQMVGGCDADVCVVALVGERGREVREFVERTLGPERLARSVVVVATSDRPAMERVTAAFTATAIAEALRDEGLNVLLLIDSLTRLARAQREVGLAAGEMPTRQGFPTSVFTMLPALLERAGPGARAAVTAVYTVLTEGDGAEDVIAEETRGILDGHILLSGKLAAAGHYPAIDILRSRSRLMTAVAPPALQERAADLRALLAAHEEVEFLLKIGDYREGQDPVTDRAVALMPAIRAFLRQKGAEVSAFDRTLADLEALLA